MQEAKTLDNVNEADTRDKVSDVTFVPGVIIVPNENGGRKLEAIR